MHRWSFPSSLKQCISALIECLPLQSEATCLALLVMVGLQFILKVRRLKLYLTASFTFYLLLFLVTRFVENFSPPEGTVTWFLKYILAVFCLNFSMWACASSIALGEMVGGTYGIEWQSQCRMCKVSLDWNCSNMLSYSWLITVVLFTMASTSSSLQFI